MKVELSNANIAVIVSIIIPVWAAVFYMGKMDAQNTERDKTLARIDLGVSELKEGMHNHDLRILELELIEQHRTAQNESNSNPDS